MQVERLVLSNPHSQTLAASLKMILTEKHIDNRIINRLIGKPFLVDIKKLKAIGGEGLFLKSFVNKTDKTDSIKVDSKCNFEKRTDGLLLHTNISNKRTLVPIPKQDILEVEIIRGNEEIDPFVLSPMWILLKLGVSILYARYFRLRLHEYCIDQMELTIKTINYEMEFIANGYSFERQLDFFKSLNYGDKLKVEI